MPLALVYETHATTVDNELGIATGWLPGELSEAGLAQAAELGQRRRDDGIAAVYASDLARAVQTADIAFRGSGIPVRLDRRLRECDYGELNGCRVERLAQERPRHLTEPFPGGQSYADVVAATAEFLGDLTRAFSGERVLVIAHSANRWALDHLLHGADLAELVTAPFAWRPGWEYDVA
ncbi:histidine phosphatase family protein [Dactylosporangium salmoneum]